MARVLTNHANPAVSTNDTTLLTHLFDARTDLHCVLFSLVPICNTASGEVVWGEFHLHLVAWKNADVVHSHLPGDVRKNLVPIFQFDTKHRVRKRLDDRSFEDDRIFFR
jgi:hypothetical protein